MTRGRGLQLHSNEGTKMLYTIGQFADLAGLTPRALRFYDRLGLLPARRDPTNDHRFYGEADLGPARRIALLRSLGFSIADMRDLIAVVGDRDDARRVSRAFSEQVARCRREREALAQREVALTGLLRLLSGATDPAAELSALADLDPSHRREMMNALQLQSATLSARGPREHNEDRTWVQPAAVGGLYIVADGTGPAARGAIASQRAIEAFAEHLDLEALTEEAWREPLTAALAAANDRVGSINDGTVEGTACTTLTAVAMVRGVAYIAHVGDCRVYRHHAGALAQVTHDHSVVQRLIDSGDLDAAAATTHPDRHLLTSMVGAREAVPEVFLHRERVAPGVRYLIVSDGIVRGLTDDEILQILDAEPEADRAVAQIVANAEATSDDNATALVISPC